MKPLCQFKVFLAMRWSERRGIHHTEPVQAQAQFRQIANKTERLGLKTLISFVVAHAASRPIRRDDLRGAKVALRKS
jgi:aspartate aminotransferase-like enzyme